MKKYVLYGTIALLALIFIVIIPHKAVKSSLTCPTPSMTDYTAYPPFITSTSVQPNIMIVMDNSGSMFNLAYPDGWSSTITNNCSTTNCTDFTVGGTWVYPTNKYYGYFNPDYWYTYSSNKFRPQAPKTGSGLTGARAKAASEWDGNFLNWLTMRRVDALRKVLTGGKATGAGANISLQGEKADCNSRGIYKMIASPSLYMDSAYSDVTQFTINTAGGSCDGSGSGTSTFTVVRPGTDPTYNIDLLTGGVTPQGILQRMWTSVRWGISIYNVNAPTPQGGKIKRAILKNNTRGDFENDINNDRPNSNTPLAETLWTDVGYFAQTTSWPAIGSPGPRYNMGDYTVNNTNDPYNYGTGGQPLYIQCSKAFVLYITDGEPCADGNLPATLSNYAGTMGSSYNCTASSCPAVGSFSAQTLPSCSATGNVAGIEDVGLFMHTNDIRTSATKDLTGTQNIALYNVFAFAGANSTLLQYASINGGFIDSNGNNLPDLQSEWDKNNDGVPDTYFRASEGYALESALTAALNDILQRTSSGSSTSVLATTGEGEGAIYQGYFIPDTSGVTATQANWRGYVHGLFLDKDANIREDTNINDRLDYTADYIITMFFDTSVTPPRTRVYRFRDLNGDAKYDSSVPGPDYVDTVELTAVKSIWEGGSLLWTKTPNSRKIFTTIDGYSPFTAAALPSVGQMGNFHDNNSLALRPYLRASTDAEAKNIINFTRGTQISGYRTKIYPAGGSNTWKLGDIVNAAPTLVPGPREAFDVLYGDATFRDFYNKYKNRRHMLYVGANDGMLHAFNAGLFDSSIVSFSGGVYTLGDEMWAFIPRDLLPHLKWLTDINYTHVYYVDLKPKITDMRIFESEFNNPNGTHPYGWGTILIGGMRFGGKDICVEDDFDGDGASDEVTFGSTYFALDITDPEQDPKLLWTFTHSNLPLTTSYPAPIRIGASIPDTGTYFIILGSGATDYDGTSTQQGKIFALKVSTSPTGNGVISSWTAGTNYWESGVDFLTGGNNAVIDSYALMADDPAGVDVDFNGSADVMYAGNTYCANPIAAGNPEACSSSNWKGKMYRIATRTGAGIDESPDPTDWTLSVLFDSQLPVNPLSVNNPPGQPQTGAFNAAKDENGNLWVFFGAGRFLHTDDRSLDGTEKWRFYGIKDTCKPWLDPTGAECNTAITTSDLYNSTSVDVCYGGTTTTCPSVYGTPDLWQNIIANAGAKKGWYLELPDAGERTLSRPLVIGGLVIWTSYTPNPGDPCDYEGTGRLYGTYYKTGTAYYEYVFQPSGSTVLRSMDLGAGVPSAPSAVVSGENTVTIFIQQSTGVIIKLEETSPFKLTSGLIAWDKGCQ